ncbi:NADH:flavorubredoxin oxidoreductase [Vibrio orientalis CIP 102891 = ATCC 33934]|uniref:NADH:flavorubredoxin oxidoreductase n=1 Tax=Vibrio orientalis CIP 102891 = ATCC 33934 TaxID=675816 RepID=C9QF15_VIBOR|nr:NADH:flavorubredoxin reductase NorW [Vibrio orientalis]EEX94725.1 nitric oxide reductase FlRd-NAD(+) reductase [Vibrio orientalis CIP 102891 = ATCC 33934]EGU51424.1 NADH:flavorubredoxin oxidoreductase [Vibrio orientalis CIP 102891 = ATCC 33934]
MTAPLIIIGSGFSAYQLVKTLRRKKSEQPILLFTANSGDEYNKPDLSHVFTRQQSADELISLTGLEFAQQYQVELFANTRVDRIDTEAKAITANGVCYPYSALVLAMGASTFVPKLEGDAAKEVITLNSLDEYRCSQQRIALAKRVLIMGGGLIGTELAMDLAASGKQVQILEPGTQLMASVLPDFVSTSLEKHLRQEQVNVDCQSYAVAMQYAEGAIEVTSNKGLTYQVDGVISAAGLRPNLTLASQAGLQVNRGIVVDKQLKTSADGIYAIGDCAEIDGKVMAYLQPIILSANTLASTLMSESSTLTIPAMMIKVKTPSYPIQLGGSHDVDSQWKVELSPQGIVAKAYDQQRRLTGFIVTKDNINQAFSLLREVQTA